MGQNFPDTRTKQPPVAKQPSTSRAPNTKVAMVGVGGSLATVLSYVAGVLGAELPGEVAVAAATLLIFAVSYLTPEK